MKKFVLLMLFAAFLFSSCYNRRHGRTAWTKNTHDNHAKTEQVKPS